MTDLGQYGSGEEPTDTPPVRQPVRLTRRHLLAVPLILLLVEGAFLGPRLHARQGNDTGPERVASAFFTAVSTDHAAAAAALTRFPPDVDTRFTQDDLREQGGITQPTLTRTVRHGGRATATVAYTVAGFGTHSNVVLARTYEGFLHAPTWRIVGGLPVLHVRAEPFETMAIVDGRPVVLRRGTADVTMLPGVVRVQMPALPPAGAAAATVSASGDGTLVRFPSTLEHG